MRIRKSQGTTDTKWLHFFAHLQGLDKATRPHLAQFNMHRMHFWIPQVIKKIHIFAQSWTTWEEKQILSHPLPLPQQSKAGQGACPLGGREAVKPGLLQLWSSGSKLRPCRGLLFPLPGLTQQPMHQWIPFLHHFSKHLLMLYLCFVLCIVSFENDS